MNEFINDLTIELDKNISEESGILCGKTNIQCIVEGVLYSITICGLDAGIIVLEEDGTINRIDLIKDRNYYKEGTEAIFEKHIGKELILHEVVVIPKTKPIVRNPHITTGNIIAMGKESKEFIDNIHPENKELRMANANSVEELERIRNQYK